MSSSNSAMTAFGTSLSPCSDRGGTLLREVSRGSSFISEANRDGERTRAGRQDACANKCRSCVIKIEFVAWASAANFRSSASGTTAYASRSNGASNRASIKNNPANRLQEIGGIFDRILLDSFRVCSFQTILSRPERIASTIRAEQLLG